MACSVALVLLVGTGEEAMHEEVELASKEVSTEILNAIFDLRAYALQAKDKAIDMHNSNTKAMDTAMVNFIMFFGNNADEVAAEEKAKRAQLYNLEHAIDPDGPKKAPEPEKYNVIVDFAAAMKKSADKFTPGEGVNSYLVTTMNKAILDGKSVLKDVTIGGIQKKQIDPEMIGLSGDPQYLKDLAVKKMQFTSTLVEVNNRGDHADVRAAASWLMAGAQEKYASFLDQAYAEVKNKATTFNKNLEEEALKAIRSKFEETGELSGTPLAGTEAADASKLEVPVFPTQDEMAARAEAKSEEWKQKHASDVSSNKIITTIENGAQPLDTDSQPLPTDGSVSVH